MVDIIFNNLLIKPIAVMHSDHLLEKYSETIIYTFDSVIKNLGYVPKFIIAIDDSLVINGGWNYPNENRAIFINEWKNLDSGDRELYNIRQKILKPWHEKSKHENSIISCNEK